MYPHQHRRRSSEGRSHARRVGRNPIGSIPFVSSRLHPRTDEAGSRTRVEKQDWPYPQYRWLSMFLPVCVRRIPLHRSHRGRSGIHRSCRTHCREHRGMRLKPQCRCIRPRRRAGRTPHLSQSGVRPRWDQRPASAGQTVPPASAGGKSSIPHPLSLISLAAGFQPAFSHTTQGNAREAGSD